MTNREIWLEVPIRILGRQLGAELFNCKDQGGLETFIFIEFPAYILQELRSDSSPQIIVGAQE